MIKKTATKESDVKNYSDKPIISRFGPITPREESLNVAKREEISQLSIGESGLINSTLTITFDSQDLRESVNSKGTLQASIQPIILYEIAQLLPHWPQFTAYFENNEIHYYDRVDLGIAIDLDMGLKVLRIKDAELETIDTIKESVIDFSMRYMRKELKPEELVGSTITVTDLSSLDILYFHPLINGYQSAIIGIGSDSTILGHPTSLIMTFDHRISTGREAASFLKILRKNILRHVVSV
jgi:pyruvate/2-oxoglutarate dehydrogenase complex dihydrolipoamide acyltransferase (E2) component